MSPADVRAMDIADYMAMLAYMDADYRERARAARKQSKGR